MYHDTQYERGSIYEFMKNHEFLFIYEKSAAIQAQFEVEINEYLSNPCKGCSHKGSLKLLNKFDTKSFGEFWEQPVLDYLPAVSEGIMKIPQRRFSHDDAVKYAKELLNWANYDQIKRDFLFGVAHNVPKYRTAIACFLYIESLPTHQFEPKIIGTRNGEDIYSQNDCSICLFHDPVSIPPKLLFWHTNKSIADFYFHGDFTERLDINRAIMYLEEYLSLPSPETSAEDWEFFKSLITRIRICPENTNSERLVKILRGDILHDYTKRQIFSLVDILGYLNILQHHENTDKSHRIISNFTSPVYMWKASHGINDGEIEHIFGGLY